MSATDSSDGRRPAFPPCAPVLGPNELRPGASENQNASPPPLESRERSPPQGVQNPAVQTPFTGVPMQHPAVAGLSSGTKVSYRTPLA
ncbi:hypothetical protein M231_05460 [Tremella mesenterica]|uniref:Uncharacterized protein n=1 Tax=Tremella mesenterica TaxID=5217 RepID=A0A4Q1BHY2_TREME|nr:hypothetical protein M231_05460 [Tremella mesenterica]